jgi:ubiquitin-protein ligase
MNVDSQGFAEIETPCEHIWSVPTKLSAVFEEVVQLLAQPRPRMADRDRIAVDYVRDPETYERKVREFVRQTLSTSMQSKRCLIS